MQNIKELENKVNKYISNTKIYENDLLDNVEFIKNISIELFNLLSDFFENEYIVKPELKKTTIKDISKIINDYFKKINYELDFNKLISDGTINFYEDESFCGKNYYEKAQKLIDINYNGLLIDSSVLIHELSHYKNQPDYFRGITNDFLTEAIAFCDELIFNKYLNDLGYNKDVYWINMETLNNAIYLIDESIPIFVIFELYNKIGSLNKEDYIKYVQDNNYEYCIKTVDEQFYKNNIKLYFRMFYILGYYLSFYLYQRYIEDNNFYKKIKNIHQMMNTKTLDECLYYLEFDNIDNTLPYVEKFINNISKTNKKIIKKTI